MAARRRYTRKEKVAAVTAAAASSVLAAAEASGIPRTTLQQWITSPEYVELRQKTREEMADQGVVLSQLAANEIRRRLGEFEPRDLVMLYGVMIDKAQLLSGQATTRSETRDLTSSIPDHEWDALQAMLREAANAGD